MHFFPFIKKKNCHFWALYSPTPVLLTHLYFANLLKLKKKSRTAFTHWCHSNQPVGELLPLAGLPEDSIYISFPNLQLVVVIHVVIVFVAQTCQRQKYRHVQKQWSNTIAEYNRTLAHLLNFTTKKPW